MKINEKIKERWVKKIVAGVAVVALMVGVPAVYAATVQGRTTRSASVYVTERSMDGTGMMYGKKEERGMVGFNLPAPGEITEEGKDALVYMAEEEKLARDVYRALYERWGEVIFSNIAQSEQRHMDAVLMLLDRYDIEAAIPEEEGQFNNEKLATLYQELVAQGQKSLEDALKVGAMIEEIDIKDLQERVDKGLPADIKQVFENLKNGSYHHLKAFVTMLEREGVAYSPQVLSQEEYENIISMNIGRYGKGGKNGHGNGMGSCMKYGKGHGMGFGMRGNY